MCVHACVCVCIRLCIRTSVCACMCAQGCNKARSDLDPGCMNKELLHTWYGSKSPGTAGGHLVQLEVTWYKSKSPGTDRVLLLHSY